MSDKKRMLQAVWRKAWREGEVAIPCEKASQASRLRFALYDAVRGMRERKVVADGELFEAVTGLSLTLTGPDKTVVRLQKHIYSEMMQTIAGIVGAEEGSELMQTPEERQTAESLVRLQEKLAETEQPAERATPYYTRKD